MNKEKLEQEHAQLKERLAELVDFINSEEYYKQNDVEKQLVATQRSGMEMYLNALGIRLWGNNQFGNPMSSPMIGLLMSSMLFPSLSTSSPSYNMLKEQLEKDDKEEEDESILAHLP